jgi:hypothetical protein
MLHASVTQTRVFAPACSMQTKGAYVRGFVTHLTHLPRTGPTSHRASESTSSNTAVSANDNKREPRQPRRFEKKKNTVLGTRIAHPHSRFGQREGGYEKDCDRPGPKRRASPDTTDVRCT